MTTVEELAGWYGITRPNVHARRNGYAYQWARSSRGHRIDTVVIHSAENTADTDGTDTGAENVSKYMTTNVQKSPAGSIWGVSWHATVDSDSVVWTCPRSWRCVHASDFNARSLGVESAYQAAKFAALPAEYRAALLDNLAAVVAVWCIDEDIDPILRTRPQIEAGQSGLIPHGTAHGIAGVSPPSHRTDPGWTRNDWATFLSRVEVWIEREPVAPGSRGTNVETAQRTLNAGGEALEVDGIFGPATHAAVLRDQQTRGVALTGVWYDVGVVVPPVEPPPVEPPPGNVDRIRSAFDVVEAAMADLREAIRAHE